MSERPDTIFALSSGSLPCAIAIIRISGPDARSVGEVLRFRLPPPRHAMLRKLRDSDGDALDHGLVLFFPDCASATGEDVVELHVHGGRAVVQAVLRQLDGASSLRHAEPGEFTRRALTNGRIDVFEAEALGDLLGAETEVQRRRALRTPETLARVIDEYRRAILLVSAQIEAAIDHDEELNDADSRTIQQRLARVANDIETSLEHPSSSRLRDGFRVVIAGPPNAGKSTLLNRLAGREAAITSPIEGTTRDVIDLGLALGGFPVRLLDTAGLREAADPIESIGVSRAEQAIAEADILVWLGRGPPPVTTATIIPIFARADLAPSDRATDLLRVSAASGEGIVALEGEIASVLADRLPPEDEALWNDRQRDLLRRIAGHLSAGVREDDLILVAEELRSARNLLDRLSGRAGFDDLLDTIFAQFCLGK